MFNVRISLGLLAAVTFTGTVAGAQSTVKETHQDRVTLAIGYDLSSSRSTNGGHFAMQGGAAELNGKLYRGFGLTASVLGLESANNGSGTPVNLVISTFGPSYTLGGSRGVHSPSLFVQGLLGVASGFGGVYPQPLGATTSSANALALQTGGGVDVGVSRHIAVRVFQMDYLRTQLPNSTSNVQNSVRFGAGIVIR